MTNAAILGLAMLLDALLGEPRWLWSRIAHPAVLIGRSIGYLDRWLNFAPSQKAKGVLAVVLLGVGAWALGLALSWFGPVAEILIAAILLAQKSLASHVQDVAGALRRSIADGRDAVAHIVSRDCREMTQQQVARAAIESGAENLSDGVIAPAFWFLVGGLPGLLFYKAINTADSMIGYRNARYAQFGWAAARLDDILNLIPSRLTGLAIAALSGHLRAWPAIAADARRHRSPNAGWPEAAMARALNVALAGPRTYDGRLQPLNWINGTARRDIGPDQIDAAVGMLWRVWASALIVVVASAALLQLEYFQSNWVQ